MENFAKLPCSALQTATERQAEVNLLYLRARSEVSNRAKHGGALMLCSRSKMWLFSPLAS